MSNTDFNASSRLQTKTVSLLDTVSLPEDVYGEPFSSQGQPRNHWQPMLGALESYP